MTHYEILEVNENASQEVIHMAYKALCKKYHPDVFSGDKNFAEEQMKKINAAYAVLSDVTKRKEYDASFKSQQTNTQDTYSNHTQDNEQPKRTNITPKFPSGTKSGIIIGLLSFLSFTQVMHPYIENTELYDYAFGFGFRDFALLNLIMLVVPLFVFAFRKTNTMKDVKLLCLFNSIGVWVVSLILFACEITISMSIGWILAVIHYFINKHLLLQLAKREYDTKKKTIISVIISVVLLVVVIGGTFLTNNVISSNLNDDGVDYPYNSTVDNNYTNDDNKQSFSEWTEEKKEKSDFLDEHIVFVIDGFENYYYTYDEMVHVTQSIDEYEFWAYNKEAAIALDYVASNINVSNGWSTEKADFLDEYIVFVIDGFGNYYYTYDEMIDVTQNIGEYEFLAYNKEAAIANGYKHN